MPASEPASMVTVLLERLRGAVGHDPGRAPAPGRGSRRRRSGRRTPRAGSGRSRRWRPRCGGRSSRPRARISSRSRPLARNQAGTAVNGRTTAGGRRPRPGRTPRRRARRAGSTGESAPPWKSSVIRVTLASTSATSSDRGGRLRVEPVDARQRALPAARARISRPSEPPGAPRRAPAGAPRTPRRTCRRRTRRGRAGPRRRAPACRSRGGAARRGRAAARRRR